MNKNIYLIPTTKESNLAIIDGKLEYDAQVRFLSGMGVDGIYTENQFIYITNNEALVLGGYHFNSRYGDESRKTVQRDIDSRKHWEEEDYEISRIVLTNDPTLIADGVQEIEKSVLISFAENPPDYVEVTKILQTRWGTEWHDLPNQKSGREPEGIYRTIYSVNFPKKEHQILTDLKDYFKNTSPEKIKSDWEETKEKSPKGVDQELLREFKILEGIEEFEFDEKDWARFGRFCENRAKKIETEEKSYTKEQLKEAFNAGMNCPIAGATFEEWFKNDFQI